MEKPSKISDIPAITKKEQSKLYSFVFSQIATEGLRIEISPGISQHMAKLIRICMNEDPGKRPSFEQVITVLEKMMKNAN